MNLPKIIALDGPRIQANALATALIDEFDCTYQDFTEPVRDALLALHYNNDHLAINWDDPAEWQKFVPFTNDCIANWLNKHAEWMRCEYGRDIFGRLFANNYHLHWEGIFSCLTIRDWDEPKDIEELVKR